MTEDQVLDTLKEILERDFKVPRTKVTAEATFRGALGLDSLDAVDLVYLLCKAHKLKANLHDWRELHTVEKVVQHLAKATQGA